MCSNGASAEVCGFIAPLAYISASVYSRREVMTNKASLASRKGCKFTFGVGANS